VAILELAAAEPAMHGRLLAGFARMDCLVEVDVAGTDAAGTGVAEDAFASVAGNDVLDSWDDFLGFVHLDALIGSDTAAGQVAAIDVESSLLDSS
jgi:hypothetical protein